MKLMTPTILLALLTITACDSSSSTKKCFFNGMEVACTVRTEEDSAVKIPGPEEVEESEEGTSTGIPTAAHVKATTSISLEDNSLEILDNDVESEEYLSRKEAEMCEARFEAGARFTYLESKFELKLINEEGESNVFKKYYDGEGKTVWVAVYEDKVGYIRTYLQFTPTTLTMTVQCEGK